MLMKLTPKPFQQIFTNGFNNANISTKFSNSDSLLSILFWSQKQWFFIKDKNNFLNTLFVSKSYLKNVL
jgi:hypothetical protein